jgi:putative ABC transport system permease protein
MTNLWSDVRTAARTLAKSPGYAVATIAILALGIGANAAIFSAVHAVLLRPLPYPDADRMVRVWETYSRGKGRGTVSYENYRDWRAEADRFAALAAYWSGSRSLQGSGEAERLRALEATADFWAVLGARPLAGRFFTEAEEIDEQAQVVVLGEGLWRRRFGADPAVVGSTLVLDGRSHVVLGVLPARARYPLYGDAADLYLPHRKGPSSNRGNHYLSVLGRLREDADLDAARVQLEQIAARLERELPEAQTGRSVELRSLPEVIRGHVRPLLLVLFAAVGAVLAIACANLAGLALARAETRRRAFAIRAALGASRGRLVREQLVESALLVTTGAAGGALVARGLLAAVRPAAAAVLPDLGGLELDAAAFAFLLAAAAVTGIGFALAPAFAAGRDDVARGLAATAARVTGHGTRHRTRRALVAGQVALTLTLLVGAGLLLRTFLVLQATTPGFDRVGVLTVHLARASSEREPGTLAPTLLTPVLERLGATAGVEAAGLLSILPVQSWGTNTSYSIEGLEPPPPGEEWWVEHRAASPGAFEALGVPLRAGRFLTEADGDVRDRESTAPLPATVNETFARRHFGEARAALGRRINLWGASLDIVGVVGDVRQAGLDREPLPELTLPYNDARLEPVFGDDVVLVVRSSLPTAAIAAAVRAAVREVAPEQPVHTLQTLDQVLASSLAERRMALALVAAFAVVAALLAGTGLYALIAYLVTQRRREIGVRMALGASARAVGRWVVGEGLALAGAGAALGIAGGWGATRLVASQLHGVGPFDLWTWLGVLAATLALALGASLVPALRAAHTEPTTVLRDE